MLNSRGSQTRVGLLRDKTRGDNDYFCLNRKFSMVVRKTC